MAALLPLCALAAAGAYAAQDAQPSAGADWLKLSGWLQQETAYRISSPNQLSQIMNTAYLSGDGTLLPDVTYRLTGRGYYDAAYSIENYPLQVERDQKTQLQLRDSYIDISKGPFDLRVGNQQIVWGEALGTFVADVVNARDYRWFILPDYAQMRIPDYAADLELTLGDFHGELVWLPDPGFDRLGLAGSEFPAPFPTEPGAVPVQAQDAARPAFELKNGEYGGRLTQSLGGWDVSVFGLNTWDKDPVLPRTLTQSGGLTIETFYPEYRRLQDGGLTFSKDLRGWVLHGEFLYVHNKYFSVLDPNVQDGLVRRDYADYLAAVDHDWGHDVDTDLQVVQRSIFDYRPDLFQQSRLRTNVSLQVGTRFFNGRLRPGCLVVGTIGSPDGMVRPSVLWRASEWLTLTAGADLFYGRPGGIFGQYADKKRAYTQATVYF